MQTSDKYYKPLKNIIQLLQSIDGRLENIENQLSDDLSLKTSVTLKDDKLDKSLEEYFEDED